MTHRGYWKAEVAAARRKISACVPGAEFAISDYGYGLSVRLPPSENAYIVFQPGIADLGQRQIKADVDHLIRQLNQDRK